MSLTTPLPRDAEAELQPEGRLQQATFDLLSGSDIQFRRETRLDIALVKNHPIALVFLPAADIPTFVGEGRVDLGITGGDQVAEHEAHSSSTEETGVEKVLDLGFGRCKLQVQVPEKGDIKEPEGLVGRNIVTSFVGLTEQYFARLEDLGDKTVSGDGDVPVRDRLRTKIKYVGGSVEAACALGVAHGIVDLVGKILEGWFMVRGMLTACRIWRDDESSGLESNRHSRRKHGYTNKIETPLEPKARRHDSITNQRCYKYVLSPHPPFHLPSSLRTFVSCPKIRPLPIQRRPQPPRDRHENHTWHASSYDHSTGRFNVGSCQLDGIERKDSECDGRADGLWCY